MTISTAGHQFTANKLSKTWISDVFLNIQKRRESVQFKTTSSSNNLNLAFIHGQALHSDENLSIRDRSTVLPENRAISRNTDQVLKSVDGFNIETEQFLVTDVFTDPIGNQPELPLFYQHVINRPLAANEVFADIQVLDTNFQPVTLIELKIDTNEGVVYNNLINSFSEITGLYDLFYITYLVRNTGTGLLTRFTELISNEPVYRIATFADLDSFGNFLPNAKVYIIQEDIGANFTVRLPLTANYGIRRIQEQRLRLVVPPSSTADDPWFVSVQNSNFISSVNVGLSADSVFKYRIAEFGVQNFAPFFPFKLSTESSSRVNRRTIKTIKNRIVQNTDEDLYVDIFVYDKNENLRFAITSDPAKVGQPSPIAGINYANVQLGNSSVAGVDLNDGTNPVAGSSIDGLNGFIVLPAGFEIESTDIIRSSYYYEEDKYEISFINLNPLANTELVKQRVVVFVRPEPLGSTLTQTLFYLIVNEDGVVVESNYNIDGVEASLFDGVEVQTAIENGQLWYDRDPSTVSWAPANSVDFVANYTVQGNPNPQAFLILGEIYIREAIQPNSLVLNDIRLRGGGIGDNKETELDTIQPEVAWNWDIGMWDGYPYPGAASYFIEIPANILESCGGLISPGSVRGIVQRHTGYGIWPVIHKYNDYEPTITTVNITSSSTYLEWTKHPKDAVFDVYLSALQTGPWVLTVSGLEQRFDENSTFLNLPAGVNRYIIVTGRKSSDGPVCFSGPVDIADPGNAVPPSTISGFPSGPLTHQVDYNL